MLQSRPCAIRDDGYATELIVQSVPSIIIRENLNHVKNVNFRYVQEHIMHIYFENNLSQRKKRGIKYVRSDSGKLIG